MKKDIGAKLWLYPTPVLVVSTYDREGKPNAMTAAWGGICCSTPPCVTVSLRKATYTYQNLIDRGAYVINIPSEAYVKEADYFGIASGRDEDKFAKTGLTALKSDFVDAPYIAEFPLNLECKIVHVYELGLHTQFVGEVVNVKVDAAFTEKDIPLIEQIRPLLYATDSREYYGIGEKAGKAFSIGKEL